MVLDISGCLEVGVELLRIKGWKIREGTECIGGWVGLKEPGGR